MERKLIGWTRVDRSVGLAFYRRIRSSKLTPLIILLPDQTARIWFTDPPYYDAIPYADLSDFFPSFGSKRDAT